MLFVRIDASFNSILEICLEISLAVVNFSFISLFDFLDLFLLASNADINNLESQYFLLVKNSYGSLFF